MPSMTQGDLKFLYDCRLNKRALEWPPGIRCTMAGSLAQKMTVLSWPFEMGPQNGRLPRALTPTRVVG